MFSACASVLMLMQLVFSLAYRNAYAYVLVKTSLYSSGTINELFRGLSAQMPQKFEFKCQCKTTVFVAEISPQFSLHGN